MAFLDKLQDAMKTVGDTASETVESAKLRSKINSEKKDIEENFMKIGQIYYGQVKAGAQETTDEGIRSLIYLIDEHNRTVDALEKQLGALKPDTPASNIPAETAVPTETPDNE